jgi:hypothetical protein
MVIAIVACLWALYIGYNVKYIKKVVDIEIIKIKKGDRTVYG